MPFRSLMTSPKSGAFDISRSGPVAFLFFIAKREKRWALPSRGTTETHLTIARSEVEEAPRVEAELPGALDGEPGREDVVLGESVPPGELEDPPVPAECVESLARRGPQGPLRFISVRFQQEH